MEYYAQSFDVEIQNKEGEILTSIHLPCRPHELDIICIKGQDYQVTKVEYVPGRLTTAGLEFAGFLATVYPR